MTLCLYRIMRANIFPFSPSIPKGDMRRARGSFRFWEALIFEPAAPAEQIVHQEFVVDRSSP